MNKLSELGSEILNHKIEINKDYPEIVKNALIDAVKVKVEDDMFDDLESDFKNPEMDINGFKLILLSIGVPFSKTQEELLEEFKIILRELMSLVGDDSMLGDIDMKKEAFILKKTITFNDEFFKTYFGIKDKDITKYMSDGSFIQAFSMFRFPVILNTLIKSMEYDGDKYLIDSSPAYFSSKTNAYGIELLFLINIEDALELKVNNDLNSILSSIKENKIYIEAEFEKRMFI